MLAKIIQNLILSMKKFQYAHVNHTVQITVTVFYSLSISADVTPSLKTIITENMKSKISILKRTYEPAREKIL